MCLGSAPFCPKRSLSSLGPGNPPPRTVETTGGNAQFQLAWTTDGIEAFITGHLPYLATLGTPIIVSIAGRTCEEFVEMARTARRSAGRCGIGIEPLLSERPVAVSTLVRIPTRAKKLSLVCDTPAICPFWPN